MSVKVAINGFGRIGRLAFRQMFGADGYEVVAINDLTKPSMLAHLLKYDTAQGGYAGKIGENKHTVSADDEAGTITVDGKTLKIYAKANAAELPWGEIGVDVVLECTGFYTSKAKAQAHIDAGAKKVVISAPAGNDLPTIVYNVNHNTLTADDKIISAASCTTNCLAPIAKVLDEAFGITEGLMTTVHSATGTQKVVDGPSKKDWRGGRAACGNIIPSTTGAAKAVGKVYPKLNGKLTGISMRVPTLDVSVVDLTCNLAKPATKEDICAAMKAASEKPLSEGGLAGVLGYTEDAVVSSDFLGDERTSIFDANAGVYLTDTFVKVVSWYDNEWGYSNKLLMLIEHMAEVDNK